MKQCLKLLKKVLYNHNKLANTDYCTNQNNYLVIFNGQMNTIVNNLIYLIFKLLKFDLLFLQNFDLSKDNFINQDCQNLVL